MIKFFDLLTFDFHEFAVHKDYKIFFDGAWTNNFECVVDGALEPVNNYVSKLGDVINYAPGDYLDINGERLWESETFTRFKQHELNRKQSNSQS